MGLIFLIAIAAAAASTLLAAGAAQGSLMAVPLFYLSSLPLMIAGIAFSPIASGLAIVLACVTFGVLFSGSFLLGYLVSIALPAFGLSYAAMLARPNEQRPGLLNWFPVGHLTLLAAVFGTLSVWVLMLITLASDHEAYFNLITDVTSNLLGSPVFAPGNGMLLAPLIGLVALTLPMTGAVFTMLFQLVGLYLAGRVARAAGLLRRPWPQISDLRLPRISAFFLIGAVVVFVLTFGFVFDGLEKAPAGSVMMAVAAAAALATAVMTYSLAGYAVVHAITIGAAGRPVVLVGLWLTTVVLGWPLLAMAALGVADALFDFRARFASGLGPPAANDR